MSKVLNVKQQGHYFVMQVQLSTGHREQWTYVREETSTGVAFHMVEREDL